MHPSQHNRVEPPTLKAYWLALFHPLDAAWRRRVRTRQTTAAPPIDSYLKCDQTVVERNQFMCLPIICLPPSPHSQKCKLSKRLFSTEPLKGFIVGIMKPPTHERQAGVLKYQRRHAQQPRIARRLTESLSLMLP